MGLMNETIHQIYIQRSEKKCCFFISRCLEFEEDTTTKYFQPSVEYALLFIRIHAFASQYFKQFYTPSMSRRKSQFFSARISKVRWQGFLARNAPERIAKKWPLFGQPSAKYIDAIHKRLRLSWKKHMDKVSLAKILNIHMTKSW